MTTIEDIIREPEFDPRDRCYVYPGGKRVPEIKHFAIMQNFKRLGEESAKKSNLELELKALEANIYMSEMSSCQSPSVAISRTCKRVRGRSI